MATTRSAGTTAARARTEAFDAPQGRPYAGRPEPGNHSDRSEIPLADTSPARGRWAVRHVPPTPRSIVELLRAGTLDAELAATLWVLIEGRVPVIVAAAGRRRRQDHAPRRAPRLPAAGRPDRASSPARARPSTGCRRPPSSAGTGRAARCPDPTRGQPPIRPDDTVLLVPELSDHLPVLHLGRRGAHRDPGREHRLRPGGDDPRRRRSRRSSTTLRRPPVGADDDELSRLGVVLILRRVGDGRRRVVAAHYVRPTARDEHGHVQRLGPAVLATWDPNRRSIRALRLGRHARARAARRAQGRRLRARGRSPPRLPRRPRRGRHRRRRRRPRRHRRLPTTTRHPDPTPIAN